MTGVGIDADWALAPVVFPMNDDSAYRPHARPTGREQESYVEVVDGDGKGPSAEECAALHGIVGRIVRYDDASYSDPSWRLLVDEVVETRDSISWLGRDRVLLRGRRIARSSSDHFEFPFPHGPVPVIRPSISASTCRTAPDAPDTQFEIEQVALIALSGLGIVGRDDRRTRAILDLMVGTVQGLVGVTGGEQIHVTSWQRQVLPLHDRYFAIGRSTMPTRPATRG